MRHFLHRTLHIAGLALAISPSAATFADCPPWWSAGPFYSLSGSYTFDDAVVFDDDGPGPHAPALYVAGFFTDLAGVPGATGIAKWDGTAWSALDGGVYGTVIHPNLGVNGRTLIIYDADGDGPALPKLVLGGRFTFAGVQHQVIANSIAAWDGQQWSALGEGLTAFEAQDSRLCLAMTLLDEDGPGPNPPHLVVGGIFDHAGPDPATSHRSIGLWNGAAWVEFADIVQTGGFSRYPTVEAMAAFDDDGDGFPTLFISGFFEGVNGINFSNNARRSPAGVWSAGIGTRSPMRVLDPDGPGPAPTSLFATGPGGLYQYGVGPSGPTLIPNSGSPGALAVFDFDGAGPELPRLVAGAGAVGVNSPLITSWDGTTWYPLGAGLSGTNLARVTAIVLFDDATDGSPDLRLFALGWFTGAFRPGGGSSIPTPGIAEWGDPLQPAVVQDPADQSVAYGAPAQFSVVDVDGPNTYQWRKDGALIFNDGNVTGVNSATLHIASAHPVNEGEYDVVVTNTCGSDTSETATLDVLPPPCAADLNGDGAVTSTDLAILLGGWGPNFTQADLNGDHVVNSQDLALLLGAWGPCS